MRIITSRNSWLVKCLFLGVYFIFFAVQVHLRYAFHPFQGSDQQPTVAKHTTKDSRSLGQNSLPGKEARPEVKLNKRFYPTPVYGSIPIQFDLQQELIVLQKQVLALTPPLSSTLLTCLLLRGPPAGC